MQIEVPVRIRLILRREALAAMAREFAFTMGVTEPSTLDTITDGISKGLLRRVEILLYNAAGQDVGYVFFEVDWENHTINAGRGDRRQEFRVDINKNIAEQVAPVTAFVSSYLHAEALARGVTRTSSSYNWVESPDQEKLNELRRKHGLSPISDDKRALLDYYRPRASKFGDDEFSEMSSGGAFRSLEGKA